MYVIVVYCPVSHLSLIKEAMFAAGGGQIGDYDSCSFEYKGLGQFRAGPGARPFVGQRGEVEVVEEVKLEMVCKSEYVGPVLRAMGHAHPYEEPAYHVLKDYSAQFSS